MVRLVDVLSHTQRFWRIEEESDMMKKDASWAKFGFRPQFLQLLYVDTKREKEYLHFSRAH